MKRIYICSPSRAHGADELKRNIAYAQSLALRALECGNAPYAPHLYLPGILDDSKADDRVKGVLAGLRFLEVCDEIWVGAKHGVSEGMKKEIEFAKARNIAVRIHESEECANGESYTRNILKNANVTQKVTNAKNGIIP